MSIRRTLIIDSPDEVRRYLDDFRAQSGSVAVTAATREDALGYLDEGDIALVVLDFTADQATRSAIYFDLLAMPVHHATPVVFLVDRAGEDTVRSMLQRPFDRIAAKPISGRRLAEVIAEALQMPSRQNVELWVRMYRIEGADPFPLRAKILNISAGGLFVQTQAQIEIAERLRVAMRVPGSDSPFEIEAIVRRKETMGQDIGYGLQFVRVLSGDKAALKMAYGIEFNAAPKAPA